MQQKMVPRVDSLPGTVKSSAHAPDGPLAILRENAQQRGGGKSHLRCQAVCPIARFRKPAIASDGAVRVAGYRGANAQPSSRRFPIEQAGAVEARSSSLSEGQAIARASPCQTPRGSPHKSRLNRAPLPRSNRDLFG